jgi:hypothetical protein
MCRFMMVTRDQRIMRRTMDCIHCKLPTAADFRDTFHTRQV